MCEKCEEEKRLKTEIKSLNADMEKPNKKGEFVFTASTETIDREGDVIKMDGWLLDNFKDGGVLLWGHDQTKLPVGRVLWVKNDEGKLVGKGRFNGQTQLSKDVERLVRMGDLTGISVGFRALDATKSNEGTTFNKQELLEVSIVNVPANPDAVIHTIKNLDLQSDDLKLACYKSMKFEEKETVQECVDRKVPIIMDESPDMEQDQAVAIAHNMCEEDQEKEVKADGDCPMDNPECSNYTGKTVLPEIDIDSLLELKSRIEILEEKVFKKKNNVDKKEVEIDLRDKRTKDVLRRAISKYLESKSK